MSDVRRRPFLTAEWRYLVMLNYEVDPAILRALVPRNVELDLWHGRALASVVGFRFLRTRLLGVPIPLHRSFEEVNLRFYVRRVSSDGAVRRGVVFVRELVPRLAIALTARLAYNEPYTAVPMRSSAPAAPLEHPETISYEWRMGSRWQRLSADAVGSAAVPAAASEEAFITEHYWGYARQRNGATMEYEVRHAPWRVWSASNATLDADLPRLYGSSFARALASAPASAFVAEGSSVSVHRPRLLD